MTRKHVIIVWLALAIAVICQASLFAQAPTGTVLGTVKDPSGAVVPKATVSIVNQSTNFKRSTISDDAGDYQLTLVDAAVYTLTVESAGFKKYVQPDVPLTARQILRVDLTVQVGQAVETVTVTATVTPVNSESVAIGESYAAAGIDKAPIPLSMNNYLTEVVGMYSMHSLDIGSAQYKVDGARTGQVRFIVDGRVPNYYGAMPLEATSELKMTTVNANAEFSTPASFQANSKGGGNAFHATAEGVLIQFAWTRPLQPYPQCRKL